MYSRNCGSNWPRSWALIARSTRGSALIGPGPISSRGAGLRSLMRSAMRVRLQPVARDIDAPREPDFAFRLHVFQKVLQRGDASWPSRQPAVQPDRHHARHAAAFFVKHIEGVFQVIEKLLAGVEA